MDHPIKRDHGRFKKIVKGKIRQGLQRYISGRDMIVMKGNGKFRVAMPQIDIPQFKFGEKSRGGVGQGEGQPGDTVGEQGAEGKEQAGSAEGDKQVEVELSPLELAQILGEELQLPRIEPKGKDQLASKSSRYTSIGTVGPDSLKHFKRTYKNALKRQIALGSYDPNNPEISPMRGDYRYRSARQKIAYENSAVVIYMMDVSGSMGDEQKEIVRTESFWINLWLKFQYQDIEIRYLIHDATAKEVNEETFFSTRESGGTLISSAYQLCHEIIKSDYDIRAWNIYPFHFSDGDNWSSEDSKSCLELLQDHIMPMSNMFCYGQVESRYGSGQFYKDLTVKFGAEHDKIILSKIKNKDAILASIRDFLGKGN